MSNYSVAEAKNRLPSLIRKAMEGEEVIITRHGKPVVELRATAPSPAPPADRAAFYDWLRARRESRPSIGITSVELLNELYEEE